MQTRKKLVSSRQLEEHKEVTPEKDESDIVNDAEFEVEHASSDDDENSTKQTNLMITEDQVSDECKSETSSDYADPHNHFDEQEEIREYAKL